MAIVNKFNVNKEQVTLDADIIENMSANDVSYNSSLQYDENTVGDKLSDLATKVGGSLVALDVNTLSPINGIINSAGTPTHNPASSSSHAIMPIKKGEYVKFNAAQWSDVMQVSFSTKIDSGFAVVPNGYGADSFTGHVLKTIEYTAENDGYIGLCWRNADAKKLEFKGDGVFVKATDFEALRETALKVDDFEIKDDITSSYNIVVGSQSYGNVGAEIKFEVLEIGAFSHLVVDAKENLSVCIMMPIQLVQAMIQYTDANGIIVKRDALKRDVEPLKYFYFDLDFPEGSTKAYVNFYKPSTPYVFKVTKATMENINDAYAKVEGQSFVERIVGNIGKVSNGYPIKGVDTEVFGSYYSPLYKMDGKLIDIPEGTRIACFGKNFNLLDTVYSIESILEGTEYFRINGLSEFEIKYRNSDGKLNRVYEPYRSGFLPFAVEVSVPMDNPIVSVENVEKTYTSAWVSLPLNYKNVGNKHPLVVFCTGTGGAPWSGLSAATTNIAKYFNSMGYALLVVNACSHKYKSSPRTNAATPLGIRCFEASVKYATSMFNLDDNVYCLAKSAGGISVMNLINNSSIKIRCAAINSPNLDAFNDFRCSGATISRYYFEQFNMAYDETMPTAVRELKDKAYEINGNGLNPIMCNTTADVEEYTNAILNHTYPLSAGTYPNSAMKDYSDTFLLGEDMQRIVSDKKLMLKKPVKIWYSEDDEQIPYGTIEIFAKMANNAGCCCKLRKFPDGTGGHACVDGTQASAYWDVVEKINVTTKYGETMEVARGLVEILNWFEGY